MKTATLTLKRKVLVIEFPKDSKDYKLFNDKEKPYVSYWQGIETKRFYLPEGSYTLLGSPDELKEEDLANVVHQSIHSHLFAHYVKDIPVNTYCYKTAIESFNSALSSEIYWVNPFEKPTMEKYGWYSSNSQEEQSGWIYEEGEEMYYKFLKEFEEAESRTFDRTRSLIFVEN